ncbi:MAG TPA: 2-oxoglutarate and iron-dependent oxygenase domain-containing protein [Blastocatellia bacterium]|nr:2-oxoglutarate and iron-dependent oxygenase domain-containing protein [Blastocatellia bacterium]
MNLSLNPMLPVLDARIAPAGTAAERRAFNEQLRTACYETGAFYLRHHGIADGLCRAALAGAERFFALPAESKARCGIRHSKHFRGYSHLSNARDCREQMHFGLELPACPNAPPGPAQLSGPNLWPAELGDDWRETMTAFLRAADLAGRRLLAALEPVLSLPPGYFAQQAQPAPYLLMKLLCYPPSSEPARQGIAPHCDWSWLTLLLQQQAGLQVRARNGRWLDAPPVADSLIVNLGELLALVTAGECHAVPHQVRLTGSAQPRLSIPVFINPALPAVITPKPFARATGFADETALAHVHRVVAPRASLAPFVFGESEWRRKGLGVWCYDAQCRAD